MTWLQWFALWCGVMFIGLCIFRIGEAIGKSSLGNLLVVLGSTVILLMVVAWIVLVVALPFRFIF